MPKLTEADVEREHVDYGTNTVRFLISWRMVEPEPGRYDTAYLDRVETMVGWYAKRGYSVMLDMHQDVYSQFGDPPLGGNGAPAWAVHTDGLPWKPNPEMWELGYLEPAVMRACYAANVGKIQFGIDPTTKQVVGYNAANVAVTAASPTCQANAQWQQAAAIVDAAVNYAKPIAAEVIGSATAPITRAYLGTSKDDRSRESTMSNLLAQQVLESINAMEGYSADLAFQNPGGVREDLIPGEGNKLNYGQAALVVPFNNTLKTADYTGAQIKAILEEQWQPDGALGGAEREQVVLGDGGQVVAGVEHDAGQDGPAVVLGLGAHVPPVHAVLEALPQVGVLLGEDLSVPDRGLEGGEVRVVRQDHPGHDQGPDAGDGDRANAGCDPRVLTVTPQDPRVRVGVRAGRDPPVVPAVPGEGLQPVQDPADALDELVVVVHDGRPVRQLHGDPQHLGAVRLIVRAGEGDPDQLRMQPQPAADLGHLLVAQRADHGSNPSPKRTAKSADL
jgi:hypothetical protein